MPTSHKNLPSPTSHFCFQETIDGNDSSHHCWIWDAVGWYRFSLIPTNDLLLRMIPLLFTTIWDFPYNMAVGSRLNSARGAQANLPVKPVAPRTTTSKVMAEKAVHSGIFEGFLEPKVPKPRSKSMGPSRLWETAWAICSGCCGCCGADFFLAGEGGGGRKYVQQVQHILQGCFFWRFIGEKLMIRRHPRGSAPNQMEMRKSSFWNRTSSALGGSWLERNTRNTRDIPLIKSFRIESAMMRNQYSYIYS